MFAEETARLKCRKGTRLGRPVLPLVCRTRAMSSAVGSVAEPPVGAFARLTLPCSLISTEKEMKLLVGIGRVQRGRGSGDGGSEKAHERRQSIRQRDRYTIATADADRGQSIRHGPDLPP